MDQGISIDILMLAALPTPWRQNRNDDLQPCYVFIHLPALTSPLYSTAWVKLSHEKFLRKTQKEHLSSSSADLFLKITQIRVKQKSSLYDMKGYVKDVNEARHVKPCQVTVKMDMVLVSIVYVGLFLLEKENKST